MASAQHIARRRFLKLTARAVVGAIALACFVAAPALGADDVAASRPTTQPAAPRYAWRQTATTLPLMNRDHVVWQFNFAESLPKPYFHPIALAD